MILNIEVSKGGPFGQVSQLELRNGIVPAVGDFVVVSDVCFRVKYRYFDFASREVLIRCVVDKGIFEGLGHKAAHKQEEDDFA